MVSVYTIDGEVTLDTAPFDGAIEKLITKLDSLKEGLSNLGINTRNFQSELGVASNEMSNLETGASSFKNRLAESLNEMGSLNNQTGNIKNTMSEINEDMRNFSSETGVVQSNVAKTTAELTKQREVLTTVKNEIGTISTQMSQLRYDREFIENATVQGLTQITQKNREIGETIRANTDIYKQQQQVHEAELSIYSDIIARLEQEGQQRMENLQMAQRELQYLEQQRNAEKYIYDEIIARLEQEGQQRMENLQMAQRELQYLEQQRNAEKYIYDEIIARLEAEGRIYTSIAEQIGIASERNAIEERELMFLDEQLALRTEILALTREGTAESVKKAETLVKELQGDENIITAIQEEIAMTKELLSLEESRVGVANATAEAKTKSAVSGMGSSVNQLDKMGNLPRRIGSMALTMWGFNELMDIYNTTMSHINAESQRDYFAKRMNMNTKALNNFKGELASMQQQYRKLDMTVVGANALETASKYKVQASSLGDLTEVMAIYGSEFVKQGRTQEDSILAVNDALDGELRRLKEVGIGKEELEATGLWSGEESDKEGMLKALLQIAEERGYSQTAKDITNLSDAISTLEVKLGIDLAQAFKVIEPVLMEVGKNFIFVLECAEKLGAYIKGLGKDLGNWLDSTFGKGSSNTFFSGLTKGLGLLITFFITYKVVSKIKEMVSGFKLLGSAWTKLMEKLGRTKGIEKATETFGKFEKTTTGGTVGNGKNVGFKEGFKEGIQGLGKNLGTMAKVFVEVAVALAMAFALIEEALVLISGIGATYDALKPQFDSGIKFIQEFGIWIWGASAVLIAFMGYIGKFEGLDTTMVSGAKTMAIGMALAMGLITEAILLLQAPLFAIASLGFMKGVYGQSLTDGIAVIRGVGETLNMLAQDKGLMVFIAGFFALSLIMGFGGAELIGLPMAVGMAVSMGLIAEAIFLLQAPLFAIASLGSAYATYGESTVQSGVKVITMVGNCLKALEPAVRNLLAVDVEMFGVALVDFATRLVSGGKDGITALSEDIIPKFVTFAKKLNEMEIPSEIGSDKITALTTIANQIPPLYRALQSVNTALATSDAVGNMGGAISGSISNAVGMGLQGKLDQIYNDSKAIMDWATKMSGLSGSSGTGGASAVTQVAQVIVDLKAKLTQMSTTISASANSIQTSATQLGRSIITGWKSGSASFGATVVQTVANGVKAVQNRYNTMANGGRTLGNKLSSGFNSHSPKLQKIVSDEIQYALWECDANEQNFYDRGAKLGSALADGFEGNGGLVVGSPARIARAIAQEMIYSKNAIDMGAIMMYRGGQALGSALADGYADSQLKTNIGMLTQTGVSNEEITNAQTRKPPIQAQQGQGNPLVININMNGANIFGVEDLENTMRNIADKVFIEYNDINPNIGG